jgi:hypothetical protein
VRRLATKLVIAALLAGCGDDAAVDPAVGLDEASRCNGGYGLAVHVAPTTCGVPFADSQVRLSSAGAEHIVEEGPPVAITYVPWPMDFFLGGSATVAVTAGAGACTLTSPPVAVTIDPAACVSVTLVAACTCP